MIALVVATSTFMAPLVQPSNLGASVVMNAVDMEATRDPAASATGATATVTGWQPAALAKIAETLHLTPNEYAADFGFDSTTVAGAPCEILSYEGPGVPNVAWCSGLTVSGAELARGSIAVFCGPLTDVPHLVASCGVSNGGIVRTPASHECSSTAHVGRGERPSLPSLGRLTHCHCSPLLVCGSLRQDLYIDYRPRAEGAYDPAYATLADYPAPETREAFAEGGNRKDFAAAFFTEEAEAAKAALLALDGVSCWPKPLLPPPIGYPPTPLLLIVHPLPSP